MPDLLFSMLVRDFRGIAQATRAQRMRRLDLSPSRVQLEAEAPLLFPAPGWVQAWVLISPALSLVSQLFFMASSLQPQRHHHTSHWHQSPEADTGNKTQG